MNSEGCTFTIPRESQRRAPLTSRPNPGTSSRTRRASPSTNSQGAARCHSRIGTGNTSMPATTLAARNSACRWRKYADCPSVNLLASAIAIEAEYTITMPKVSSRSAAHSTPLSYSASGERPGLMLRSIDDSLHGLAERLAAMLVVAEHVKARAGGRKQHRVAGTRRMRGEAHCFFHACGAAYRDACTRHRRLDARRVAADQYQCARRARDHVLQGREVLPLAVAAGDENDLRIAARESGQSRDRRADVGALGVVVPAHPVSLADQLDAMRKSPELAKRREQGLERQAERAAQRERREGIRRVMQAGELHFADREERVCALREPRLAAALDETPVLRAPRGVEPESDRLSSGQRHRQAARVAPVEDLDAVARKHPRLGASVVVDATVAVQMVFGDVENRGGVGGKRVSRLELEARELQHPKARSPSQVLAAQERIEHRRPDVPRYFAVGPRGFRHRAGESGDGALAVGAGDGDDPRSLVCDRLGEQLDIADRARAGGGRALHVRIGKRHAGTDRDQIDPGEARLTERAAIGANPGERALDLGEARRRRACVGDAHVRSAARQPLRHRQTRVTQTEHQYLSARETHRSFKVDRPNSTSIMVMIQKRTTT